MGYPYRCKHCTARHTFKHEFDYYIRKPKCRHCGESDFRLDKWMLKRDTKKMGCGCSGYPFFHRKGSLFCWYRADGSGRYPGDPDFCDRWGGAVSDYDDSIITHDMVDDDIPFDVEPAPVSEEYGEAIVPF